jgi:hypothetical protein
MLLEMHKDNSQQREASQRIDYRYTATLRGGKISVL